MSSEKSSPNDRDEPARQVSDELLRKASEGPVRHLPDALFGGPGPAQEPASGGEASASRGDAAPDGGDGPAAAGAEHGVAVSDELLRKASEGPVRHLPDLLFGGSVPEPAASQQDSVVSSADRSGGAAAPEEAEGDTGPPGTSADEPATAGSVATSSAASGGVAASDVLSDTASGDESPVANNDSDVTPPLVASDVSGPRDTGDADDPEPRPVLLVLADSLAYFGPKGGLPADDPRIWPNLVAAELDWDVELVARIGWTCRDAYWALIGDPRVWAAVPRAGAVVFATGGMDSLPSPLPTALRELIRYVRPPELRRVVRDGYNWLQPRLSRLGRPVALPPRVSVDYLEQSRTSLAQLRPELPIVGVLPSVHDCEAYGRVHTGREPAVRALREWSAKTAVPLVDLGDAVRDNIFSGESNPDGIHWGWEGHTAVARAMVKAISEVRS